MMKAEFTLYIDDATGVPSIQFKHHPKSNDLEQRVLMIFVRSAMEKGVEIVSERSFVDDRNCWTEYEIRPKK